MRRAAGAALAALVAGLLLMGGVAAQDAPDAVRGSDAAQHFDRAHAELLAAPPERIAAAAAEACDRFLQLPDGPERTLRLVVGAQVALAAQRNTLALELAAAVDAQVPEPERTSAAVCQLRALARLGRLGELAGRREHVRAEQLAEALVSEEAALVPIAAAALRGPQRPAARYLFEALAAVEPVLPHRLANLALCQRQLGDLQAAEASYARALAIAADDADLWNEFGLLLRATGQRERAVAAFRRSLQLDLARPEPMRGRGSAITNLTCLESIEPGVVGSDPIPAARAALRLRPDATMLRRALLDVELDRLARAVPRR